MSDLTGMSHGIGRRASHPHLQPMNAIFVAWSRFSVALALCVLLFSAQHCMGQQRSSKVSVPDFKQVEDLIQQHRLNEAKTAVLEELQQHPSNVEGYNLLGIIQSSQQNYADAVASFQKALSVSPNSVKTHNNLGNAYVAQKQFDAAEKEFRTVVRLDPGNRDGNYNLGVLLMIKGSPAEAIPHFERVRPMNVETRINLVRAYLVTKRTPDALRMAAELSAQNENDVRVHFSLGVMLASEKQYKAAELELEKADAIQPETFEILYNLGQDLLRTAEFSKAEVTLTRALKLKPESPETLYLLAQVLTNESRPLDALDLLLHAHRIAPENTDVIFLMAQVSMSQNYFEDAIPLLESGLQIAPRRADLLAALGESYFMAGKVDKAIEEFKKLLEVEGSARSYAFLGLSYRNLGRFDEAKQYFQKGLKLDPNNSTCLFSLGFIAERQGDAAEAEKMFQAALRSNPDYADALLEMANLRMAAKRLPEAEQLLRRFVKVSRDPATGYYKLAMVERSLHETAAADRDLSVFKTLSKNASSGPYPYEHLFDYLDNRAKLAPGARNQLDEAELIEQIKQHPNQPEDLYLLAEAYLKSGKVEDARNAISQLDKLSAGDFRSMTGTGVLLARYHHYDEAIQHFQAALQTNPNSDEVKFDLANAYFRKRLYPEALDTAGKVSPEGQKDDAYLALLGDIYAHSGDAARASEIFRDAIRRNPDNDQNYLSLALIQLRDNDVAGAKQTLLKGQVRIPGSGKLFWGLGLAAALQGNNAEAARQLERAVDLLPEWSGGYSTLGVFYFEIGQIDKAKEVLSRFKNSNASASLDINRIEQVLDQASAAAPAGDEPMTTANKTQLLQLALSLADRTL
jgi:tetratricopeptide (TPR) repeat protein